MDQEKSERDEYLSYEQVSKLLNVKKETVYAWVCRKKIPHIRLGPRNVRFSRKKLEEWLERSNVEPDQTP